MVTMVTGANGVIGTALCNRLLSDGLDVRAAIRTPSQVLDGFNVVTIGSIDSDTDWSTALDGVRHIIHLAARVHIMSAQVSESPLQYHSVNTAGTLNLARQAAASGVRQFLFLSTAKVNGESSSSPFCECDVPAPFDSYAVSKWEAENGLMQIAKETDMKVVIIRPPLVYGPGVRANFLSMMHWLRSGVPLPLGMVNQNRRSLVFLDNLVDLISTCIDHPAAASQVFFAGDGEDLSTSNLLQRLGAAMGVPVRLLPAPIWMLKIGAAILGKQSMVERLCGNLQVNTFKARALLGWQPPLTVDEGLRRTAEWYRREYM